jgi:hypothetical protein
MSKRRANSKALRIRASFGTALGLALMTCRHAAFHAPPLTPWWMRRCTCSGRSIVHSWMLIPLRLNHSLNSCAWGKRWCLSSLPSSRGMAGRKPRAPQGTEAPALHSLHRGRARRRLLGTSQAQGPVPGDTLRVPGGVLPALVQREAAALVARAVRSAKPSEKQCGPVSGSAGLQFLEDDPIQFQAAYRVHQALVGDDARRGIGQPEDVHMPRQ